MAPNADPVQSTGKPKMATKSSQSMRPRVIPALPRPRAPPKPAPTPVVVSDPTPIIPEPEPEGSEQGSITSPTTSRDQETSAGAVQESIVPQSSVQPIKDTPSTNEDERTESSRSMSISDQSPHPLSTVPVTTTSKTTVQEPTDPPHPQPNSNVPAYQPSSTPTSQNASDPSPIPNNRVQLPALYQPQPNMNMNGVAFGGHSGSSNPSPSQFNGPNGLAYGPRTNAFTPPPYYNPGHTQHYSESHVPMYPQQGMPPPGFPRFPGRPPHWHNQDMHQYQRMQADPAMRTHMLSGGESLSRSGSQSSLRTPDRLPQSPMHSNQNSQPLNGAGMSIQSPTFPQQITNMEMDAAIMLRDYIGSQYGRPEFADMVVEITELSGSNPSIALPVHSLLLARSPTLVSTMGQNSLKTTSDNKKVIPINARDKFQTGPVFVEIIQHMYGASLLNVNELVQGLRPFRLDDPETSSLALQSMTRSLAHAAAGCYLAMPMVTLNALECAKRLLRWDTVERALSFALDGGLTPTWQFRSRSLSTYDRQAGNNDSLEHYTSLATYGEFSGQFLHTIVEFLAYNFPKSFKFLPTAPQLLESPRLPTALDSRSSMSNARLSRIQFGEMSAEVSGRPDFVTTIFSSILISVPFPVLKVLLEHDVVASRLGWPKVAEIMHLVIRERESRRQKVLESKRVAAGPDAVLMENTRWWERVEESPQPGPGFTLVCSKLSTENGTSNGHKGESVTDGASALGDQSDDQSAAVQGLKLHIPSNKASGLVEFFLIYRHD
jgi:hypothetical protein